MNHKRSILVTAASVAMLISLLCVPGFVISSPVLAQTDRSLTPVIKPPLPSLPDPVAAKPDQLRQTGAQTILNSQTTTDLLNGDFENGPDGSWLEYSLNNWDLIRPASDLVVTPHSGEWAVWLGGGDDEISSISQTITLPTGQVSLHFWRWIGSADVCGYDYAYVLVNDVEQLIFDLCDTNNDPDWIESTVDLSAYAGMTVNLRFQAENDSSANSNFFIDDVSLQVLEPLTEAVFLPVTLCQYWQGVFDDFSDPTSGWESGVIEGSVTYQYLNDEYQLKIEQTDGFFGITPDLVLPSDYRIEVDARKVSAGVASYGLLFGTRFTDDSWETYQVLIWQPDTDFLINKRLLDGTWVTIMDWTDSPAIRPDDESNHIRVDRIGTLIEIYINGTQVASFNDDSYTGPGRDAGLRAYSYWDVPVDIRFDNFAARRP